MCQELPIEINQRGMLDKPHWQSNDRPEASQGEHSMNINARARIILVVIDIIQSIALVQPRPPLPIDLSLDVRVRMSVARACLGKGLSSRLIIFLKEKVNLHALRTASLPSATWETCATL
jgi:hypothetical protein